MSLRSRLAAALHSLFRRRHFESGIAEEIRFHLDSRAAELISDGLSPREAARQARLEFGAMETHKDEMRRAFGVRWLEELAADLRYAARILRANPSFTAIAVTTLALAIGANTTIFSLSNEVLYLRLGVPRPQELRLLTLRGPSPLIAHSSWGSNSFENGVETLDMFTYPIYRQMRDRNSTLGPIAAFKEIYRVNLTANGEAQAGDAQLVSGNLYSVLEVTPQLGRSLLPSDDVSGAIPVALISDGFWRRVFNASPSVLGRTLNVNGAVVTVVGVNPRGFTGAAAAQTSPDVFLPLSLLNSVYQAYGNQDPLTAPEFWWVNLIARARLGISSETAAANLNAVFNAAVQGTMKINRGDHIPTVLVQDGSRGENESARGLARPIHVLLGLTSLVLLLACANIANLMLARATAREREIAVRLALGASRARVLRQVLTEGLLLSAIGGLAGMLLGYLGRNVLPRLFLSSSEDRGLQVSFSWHIFLFTAGITLLTGLVFALLPAWRSSRGNVGAGLKESVRSASRRRRAWTGKLIVAFQVALSTLLVAAAALFLRTLHNLNHVQPGFRTAGLLEIDLSPSPRRYPGPRSVELIEQVEQSLAAVPGVQSVAFARPALLSNSSWSNDFDVEGAPRQRGSDQPMVYLSTAGEHFLPMMGIPILHGRNFGPADTATSPKVAILNQTLARRYFPTLDPIGRRFSMSGGADGKTKIFYTVIGVCADTLYSQIRQPVQAVHFELSRQADDALDGTLILRTDAKARDLLPTLRRVVARIDPDLPITDVRTVDERISFNLSQEHIFASLTAGFGLLALLLACVGIYGIMAYTVTQRTGEIGIRLALGAPRALVRGMVLREALWLSFGGVVVGLLLVLALVRLVQSMLFGLQPRDPASLAGAALLLFVVALLAGWIPAVRASRLDPVDALRHE